jgi:RNA polymerase sigma-70 factor (ECF subfamily)
MGLATSLARFRVQQMIDPATESALVDRCRQNDFEAFGRLVDAYQSRVFGFVRRMVPNAEEASDLTQEVFIRAFQSFSRFDGRSSVRTWLFRIAYNLCVDRSRKASRTPAEVSNVGPDGEDQFEAPDHRWTPEQVTLNAELEAVVERGILSMSEKLRSVLLLHDREDLAYEDIALALNVPVGTVKSRLFLARAHLQKVLNEYFGDAVNA